ncbi:hypothetical protein Scep_015741 [Stephania cephalantha]|uniref:Chloroplast lumen common family protein n=1 Tax=Stephania cephalantha TaxID=152367 RepID=A0AAP0P337_9MAGN
MNSIAQLSHHKLTNPNHLQIRQSPSLFSTPISSISLIPSTKPKLPLRIKASSNPNWGKTHHKSNSEKQNPVPSLLKTTCVAFAATFLFMGRFKGVSIAAPIAQPVVESSEKAVSEEESEKRVGKDLGSNVETLRSLVEEKIKDRKLEEAISVVDRLIEMEPLEKQWPLMKAHLNWYRGDVESAKAVFEEILSKDPFFVEAYHGLVTVVAPSKPEELEKVVKRIENAMEMCKKGEKYENLREFKLLIAQVRIMEGNYEDALKDFQELVKEEPNDFRPYLSQGIVYTLLRKTDEARKQFEMYQSLVPKDHPYAQYFEDNVFAKKDFNELLGKPSIS